MDPGSSSSAGNHCGCPSHRPTLLCRLPSIHRTHLCPSNLLHDTRPRTTQVRVSGQGAQDGSEGADGPGCEKADPWGIASAHMTPEACMVASVFN